MKVWDSSRQLRREQSCPASLWGSCLLALLLAAASASANPRSNVILVMADDLGWAQTSYYGHPILKTPNLDDMA